MMMKQLVLPRGGFITINKETRKILILIKKKKEPENNEKEVFIYLFKMKT